MAARARNIPDATSIPKACRERFVALAAASARPLRDRGVELSGVSDLVPGYEMSRSRPRFHVVIYTCAGRGEFESAVSRGRFKPGHVWIAPAGVPHRYRSGPSWRMLWFHLANDRRWSSLQCERPIQRAAPALAALKAAMEGFISESIHATPDAVRAAEAYAEIIAIHLDRELAPHDDPAAGRTARELDELWHEVHADLAHPWSVGELARRAHVSQVQFHRLVGRFHNTTPMGMVTRLRMQRAEQLLINTDYPLKLIAGLVGYETPFAFSRAFKRHAGRSPKFYRAAARR